MVASHPVEVRLHEEVGVYITSGLVWIALIIAFILKGKIGIGDPVTGRIIRNPIYLFLFALLLVPAIGACFVIIGFCLMVMSEVFFFFAKVIFFAI